MNPDLAHDDNEIDGLKVFLGEYSAHGQHEYFLTHTWKFIVREAAALRDRLHNMMDGRLRVFKQQDGELRLDSHTTSEPDEMRRDN